MSILDALRLGVDHYPGGRGSLSPRLLKSDEVLRKELSGAVTTHKLGAVDAVTIAAMLVEAGSPHCHDYATAVASECGGRFEPNAAASEASKTPAQRVSSLMRETSDVASEVLEAMADGQLSDNELARVEKEISEAERVLQQLRTECRRVNLLGKPVQVPY